jgi:hypothetical protein
MPWGPVLEKPLPYLYVLMISLSENINIKVAHDMHIVIWGDKKGTWQFKSTFIYISFVEEHCTI